MLSLVKDMFLSEVSVSARAAAGAQMSVPARRTNVSNLFLIVSPS